jgi:hypothetical protein
MEVERFKHRQLAPTVGPIVMITGEFEGPIIKPIYTSKSSSFQPMLI